jgi:integrase
MIAFNPVKRIDMPKKVKYTGAKHYNEQQIEQLFECSKGDPLEIVNFLTVFYGLRRSEVLGLKWDAINMDDNTLIIRHTVVKVNKITHKADATKNDSSYSIMPMPEVVKAKLAKWREEQMRHKSLQPNDYIENGYVCTQMDGSLIKPNFAQFRYPALQITVDEQ